MVTEAIAFDHSGIPRNVASPDHPLFEYSPSVFNLELTVFGFLSRRPRRFRSLWAPQSAWLGTTILGVCWLAGGTLGWCQSDQAPEAPPTSASSKEVASDETPTPQWPLSRGDAQSTGRSTDRVPDDLVILWESPTFDAVEASPVIGNGVVVVVDVLGNVSALELESGKKQWSHSLDTGFVGSAAIRPPSQEGPWAVFAGDIDGNLYAWSLDDGQLIWKQSTDSQIDGSPAFFGSLVLVTSQDGRLYAFDVIDGSPRWQYESGDQIRCSPTIVGSQTLLGGCDAKLHRVDLRTGLGAGDPVPLDGPTGSTPAAGKSVIVVPTMSGTVFGINRDDSSIRWESQDPDQDQEYRTDAAIGDELAIVASARKHIDALSLDTGDRKWRYTLRRRTDASPVIAGDDVWIAASDGRLIRLALADGTERWVHEIRGGYAAPPAIVPAIDNRPARLIVADDTGVVRCFGKPAP